MTPPVDEHLEAVLTEWWGLQPVEELDDDQAVADDIESLLAHLARRGYRIVRIEGAT